MLLLAHHGVAVNQLQSIAEPKKHQELKTKYEEQKESKSVQDCKATTKTPIRVIFTPEQVALTMKGTPEQIEEFWAKVTEKYGEDCIVGPVFMLVRTHSHAF